MHVFTSVESRICRIYSIHSGDPLNMLTLFCSHCSIDRNEVETNPATIAERFMYGFLGVWEKYRNDEVKRGSQ